MLSTAGIGVLTATAMWSLWDRDSQGLRWLDIILAINSIIWVPITLRRPRWAGFVLSALSALSPVVTPVASMAALVTARRKPFATAVLVAAAGVVGHAVQGAWRPNPGLSYWWWLLLMAIAYAALVGWGAWAQTRDALIASLCERAQRAEQEQERRVVEARRAERTRIAREMHDVLAHRLSLLATYAGALEYRPDAPPERLAAAAGVVREGVHQALNELREVVTLMRGEEEVPVPDLTKLVQESQAAGVKVVLDDRAGELPPTVGRTAYRVVQEALTNARKHAIGQPVDVVLDGSLPHRLTIEVRNPLSGNASDAPNGVGLIGLTERVELAGGALTHERTAGEFRLSAWIPWPR